PIEENRSYEVNYVLEGVFGGEVRTAASGGRAARKSGLPGGLVVVTSVLAEEQRPPNFRSAARPREEMTEFMKETRYTGTRWAPSPNEVKRGLQVAVLDEKEFLAFRGGGVVPDARRVVDGTFPFAFDPAVGSIVLYRNPNRFTHVRFESIVTAIAKSRPPDLELSKAPDKVRSGDPAVFEGRAADNLHLVSMEVSIDDGRSWKDATEALDRGTGRFRYTWDTGKGTAVPPGTYSVVFRAKDHGGNVEKTNSASLTIEPARTYRRLVIHQDDPESPLPNSSWTLGPFRVRGKERFLGIRSESEDPGFDMDLFLFFDKNGNRKIDGMGEVRAKSTTPTAVESLVLNAPPEGVYWIFCQGWQVKKRRASNSGPVRLGDMTPGEFLRGERKTMEKRSRYALLDLFLSFDHEQAFIVDVGPTGPQAEGPAVIRGAFRKGWPVDVDSLRIAVNGKDLSKGAKVDARSFEVNLPALERNASYEVRVDAKTLDGRDDCAIWRFRTVYHPAKIETRFDASGRNLEVAVRRRHGGPMQACRVRVLPGKGKARRWLDMSLGEGGRTASARISAEGLAKGGHRIEVELVTPEGKKETQKEGFLVEKVRRAPKFLALYPRNGRAVYDQRPVLFALVLGEAKGKAESIRLILDGEDVTGRCRVYANGIKFFPARNLARGEHEIECIVRLSDGRVLREKCRFEIRSMGEEDY
ncbi:MAG: Ig-like domain-containing protein, partial [Planctomycetota bacterium]